MTDETAIRLPIPAVLYAITAILLSILFLLDILILKYSLPYLVIVLIYALVGGVIRVVKPEWFTIAIRE